MLTGKDFTSLPEEGLEPSPCCQDGILNPARLPIPPLRLDSLTYVTGVWRHTGKNHNISFVWTPFSDTTTPISAPNINKISIPRNRSNVKDFCVRELSALGPFGIYMNVYAEEADDQ